MHVNFKALNIFILTVFAAALAHAKFPTQGVPSHEVPEEISNVGVSEKLGTQLPLGLEFVDDKGQKVTLASYFNKGKPILLSMVYYNCPSLCNFHLNGISDVMKKSKAELGKDYEFVAVSMDHSEAPDLAAKKKASYVKSFGDGKADESWHFLVGSEENVKTLADALGFEFKWNESTQQFAHAAVAYIGTPAGELSRYLYGIEFSPETLRLSLIEAGKGQIGTIIDQLILFCFQFDPTKNKYTLYAFNLMRAGALLTVILLALFLVPIWLRERQRTAKGA